MVTEHKCAWVYNSSMSVVTLDLERQKQAKQYARIRRRLFLIDLGIGAVYALTWLVLGWSSTVRVTLASVLPTGNEWLLVAGFGAVFGAGYYLLNLPLSYYAGFLLPHRFALSTQTQRGWVVDQIKGAAVAVVLGGIVLQVIYALLRLAPQTWWLWAAAVLLLFNVVLANLGPILLLPLFYKFVPLEDDHAELTRRLLGLAERANTHVRGVFRFDMSRRTKAANAALTGLGNTRRIILGDTLLEEFTPDEIESVLAHELGHHVHRDIPIGILVESVLTLAGLYVASLLLQWGALTFGLGTPADIATLPVFALAMGTFGLITMPLGNSYSRWRERRADEYALQMTTNPVAFASALTRLANQNLSDVDPEPWVEMLLYSHPALGKRIAMAQAFSPDVSPVH